MTTRQITHTCFIDAPASTIYDYLAEPANYRGLQPFVVAVHDITRGTDEHGRQTRGSLSIERFQFLRFFHFDNPIRVLMTLTKPNEELVNQVKAAFGLQLEFVTTLQPENTGTRLSEVVTIQTPWLMQGYVVKQAVFAQRTRFTALQTLFEKVSPAEPQTPR